VTSLTLDLYNSPITVILGLLTQRGLIQGTYEAVQGRDFRSDDGYEWIVFESANNIPSHLVVLFSRSVDKCFVPSDVLNQAAQQRGLVPSQIVQYGLPIRKGFWSTEESTTAKAIPIDEATKKEMRKELGVDVDLPTVLVVGGGDGMGGIESISKELGDRLGRSGTKPTSQMVVVCGNNKVACNNLGNVNWGKGVKVYVKGFVNNMDEWMKASDALVTKAGPGTIAEASICGLPCMLFSYL
jgi:1,2-diacylglycerol 3-beta-galactosyltransferase